MKTGLFVVTPFIARAVLESGERRDTSRYYEPKTSLLQKNLPLKARSGVLRSLLKGQKNGMNFDNCASKFEWGKKRS